MPNAATLPNAEGAVRDGVSALMPQQRQDWERDGFLVLPRFFGDDVIDPINELIASLSDPQRRPRQLANRVVIDLLAGAAASRRMRLVDAPVEALKSPVKFNDLFLESDVIRACNLHPRLVPILDELLDGPPAVCNSLNFIQGSEQTEHIDSWFMPPPAADKMVVTSVCLEDVHPDAGPLFYYPGSHKIPPYRFSNGTIRAIDAEMPKCHDYVEGEIKQRRLPRQIFVGHKGDVFIWACQLAHGGSPIKDPKRTRRSLVTHYWRASDMPRHKLDRYGKGFTFAKDHQPIPSKPLWMRLALRARLEAWWGLRLLKGMVAGRS